MTPSETLRANDEALVKLFEAAFGKKYIEKFKRPITFYDVNVDWEQLASQAFVRRRKEGRFNVAEREMPIPGTTNLNGVFSLEMDGIHYMVYHHPTTRTFETKDGEIQTVIVPQRITMAGKEIQVDPRREKHRFMWMMLNPQFEGSPVYWGKEEKRRNNCEHDFFNSSKISVQYKMNNEQERIDAEKRFVEKEVEAMARIHDMSFPFMHKLAERLHCMPSPDSDDPAGALKFNLSMRAKSNPEKFIQESKKIAMSDAAFEMAFQEGILHIKDKTWYFRDTPICDLPKDRELDEAKQRRYLYDAIDEDMKADICDYAENQHSKAGKHKSVGRPPKPKPVTVE